MIRLMTILLLAVFTAGTARADGPWAGEWQLAWGNAGALVTLEQDGASVAGSFGNGLIRGTVRDNMLNGEIVFNGDSERVTATLNADLQSFAGTTETGDWLNGTRIALGERKTKAAIDLQNPRAALRSFLTASALAQANKSYALSDALDALDFGSNEGWAPREARFTGAQQLYQLIDRATFNMSTIPDDPAEQRITLSFPQIDSASTVGIDMQRATDGRWQIVVPSPEKLRAQLESGPPQTADGHRLLQNPRDTLRTFLDGMQHWETGGKERALATIDLSHVPEVLRSAEGYFVAQYLVRVINHVGYRTLQNVPNSGVDREPFVLFELPAGRVAIEPLGTGAETRWKFSSDTARTIRDFYRIAEQLPDHKALDPSLIPFSPMFAVRALVKQHAPFLLNSLLGQGHIEYWQVLASLLVFCAIALSIILLRRALLWVLNRPYLTRHVKNAKGLATGLALGFSFLAGSRFIVMIGLPAATRQYTVPVLGMILILILAYALWQLLIIVLSVLQELAEKTETAFDNIVLTFAAGLAKLAIVVGAVMALSYLWSLPTTGLLAGLGISGLAVAFASKETIANVFGAGILMADRPFRKGDRIIAGDVNGWVEAVGLRSTRIRTLHDSLLVVPNAKLADTVVNNLGARRRRSLSATVIVTSGATPERMEAFTKAIRQRIADDPVFEGQWAEVNISRFGAEGIDVEISTMVETRSGRASREATHKLYVDIMQIAQANGLGLAHATDPSGGVVAATQ
jgi:MscS family membrane protein